MTIDTRTAAPRPVARPAAHGKGLAHRTVSAALVEEIRQRILDGRYEAGAQLRQDVLAGEFGASRIPVREALFQLEAEGLVKLAPHRGATVSELSAEGMLEVYELRADLEPRLLAASAPLLTEADHAALDMMQAEYAAALRGQDIGRWGALNTALHLALYRHAGRPRTLALVTTLLQECDRYTRIQLSASAGASPRAEHEHAELLRLCRAGRTEAACALLRRHIDDVARTLRALLRPGEAAPG
ncbi:GntR family transcriptional regulator [Roseomonas sp. NAR14]|uniref:GntR family transcriptional regulator n=1 Tax=Roseomonas acroporae TaxID=2937791 RepID=A0A9X1Y820_9PROT|nr:GntR family transcriptional regulator [Roseomonas acroporae]MCK8784825.1 GntR family transcriptional regulator [Roseomonas acroporae]